MNKLDEIKADLSHYDEVKTAYMKVVEEFYNPDTQAHSMESRLLQQRYWNVRDTDTAWEALRVLLPVMEAAVALDYKWLQRAQREMTYTNEDLEPLNRLEEAVTKLKG